MEESQKNEIAKKLDRATLEHHEVVRFTAETPELDIPEAYEIQELGIQMRLRRGEKVIGHKMGLTSRAKMQQMGVDSPIRGILTDKMMLSNESTISLEDYIHPKIEPEIVFFVEKEIKGVVTPEEALSRCNGVCVGLEIIDSRYKNFEFQLPDVVADNCSSTSFVLGSKVADPGQYDLKNLEMSLKVDGEVVQQGVSSAIYGDPAASLAELSRMLNECGRSIEPGSIVLAGAATAAIQIDPGKIYSARAESLGQVFVSVR